jgi:hypothetical protein
MPKVPEAEILKIKVILKDSKPTRVVKYRCVLYIFLIWIPSIDRSPEINDMI